jgi:hypothetical protein
MYPHPFGGPPPGMYPHPFGGHLLHGHYAAGSPPSAAGGARRVSMRKIDLSEERLQKAFDTSKTRVKSPSKAPQVSSSDPQHDPLYDRQREADANYHKKQTVEFLTKKGPNGWGCSKAEVEAMF